MEFFKKLLLVESQISAQKEIDHVISVINSVYNEWKKTGRRKNAVDLITTTANKLSNIDPTIIDNIHEASRLKLATLLIRCFDVPYWKPVSQKERLYKKLLPILKKMENYDPNSGTGGNVREVIMTRLSASISAASENKHILVVYEPRVTKSYLRYIFGDNSPSTVIRMQSLSLPDSFDNLVNVLTVNHNKAASKHPVSQEDSDV